MYNFVFNCKTPTCKELQMSTIARLHVNVTNFPTPLSSHASQKLTPKRKYLPKRDFVAITRHAFDI